MGLGDKFLDPSYKPKGMEASQQKVEMPFYAGKIIKCPVSFTEDPMEFLESKDFMNLELRPIQRQIIIDLFLSPDETGRNKYDEAVVICGMRGGKSAVASMVSSYMTQWLVMKDNPAFELGQMPGQQISLEFIANSEEQSQKTAYAAYVSTIINNDWWKKYIGYLMERESDGGEGIKSLFLNRTKSIIFKEKNVAAWSLHSNSASLAGMTAIMVVFDELSRFNVSDNEVQEESETRSAQAVYYTASRAATSLKPYSRIMSITSPMYETDFGMQLLYLASKVRTEQNQRETTILRKKYPPKIGYNTKMIGYHYSTFEMAPKYINKFGQETGFVEEDFTNVKNQNPTTFRRDYLAIPPGSMNPFIEFPERLDLCTSFRDNTFGFVNKLIKDEIMADGKLEVRNYIAKDLYLASGDKIKRYFISCDQGEKKDSFVVSMGHIEEYVVDENNKSPYKVYIDFVEAWVPDKLNQVTVSFSNVEDIIKQLASNFNVVQVTYDQWQSSESIQRLFADGILSRKLEISTNMYDEFKRMIYSGYVDMPNNDTLLNELRQLNVVRGSYVDHLPNGSKDSADAVCRVVWSAYGDYLDRAAKGEGMLPKTVYMPTVRSVATDIQQQVNSALYGNSSNYGSAIFGKQDFQVPHCGGSNSGNGFFSNRR